MWAVWGVHEAMNVFKTDAYLRREPNGAPLRRVESFIGSGVRSINVRSIKPKGIKVPANGSLDNHVGGFLASTDRRDQVRRFVSQQSHSLANHGRGSKRLEVQIGQAGTQHNNW